MFGNFNTLHSPLIGAAGIGGGNSPMLGPMAYNVR